MRRKSDEGYKEEKRKAACHLRINIRFGLSTHQVLVSRASFPSVSFFCLILLSFDIKRTGSFVCVCLSHQPNQSPSHSFSYTHSFIIAWCNLLVIILPNIYSLSRFLHCYLKSQKSCVSLQRLWASWPSMSPRLRPLVPTEHCCILVLRMALSRSTPLDTLVPRYVIPIPDNRLTPRL